jgi:hypothetical protein
VETETGMIDLARQIVLPNTANIKQTPPFPPTAVTIWGKGIVQVLQTFIFDNDDEDDLQLVSFEHLDVDSTIRLLLSRTTPETVARNIRSLISPFIQYVNFHEPEKQVWETVWDWLLDHAAVGELEYLSNWARDGPAIDADTLQAFLRTCLTACYLYHQSSPSTRQNVHWIRDYVQQSLPNIATQTQIESISLIHPETDLLPSQLRNSSPLTSLNASSVRFLDQIIKSADIVAQYSVTPEISPRDLVTIRGSEETQKQLLDRLLRSDQSWTKRNEDQWKKLRQSLKWLQSESRVLGKLSIETVDASILTALLDASGTSDKTAVDDSFWIGKGYVCATTPITDKYSGEDYS